MPWLLLLVCCLVLAGCGEQSQPIKLAVPSNVPTSAAVSEQPPSSLPTTVPSARAGASSSPSPSSAAPSAQPVIPGSGTRALPGASRLQIPSIAVDAPLVTMGVDPSGAMQVPSNGTDVAWYSFSAVPGEPGNAVLSGHVDTATSPTAVFTRLKDLKPGEAMSVVENGRKFDFEVFWSKSWAEAVAPLPLILGNAPSPTLTLITCAGTFDRSARNYTERLVVRAKQPGSIEGGTP